MTDHREIADRKAREQALDPARSFIVQAPAGSGKTELLTQRLLALLARVEQPEEIFAITFTNKAAAEMRRRVTEALELGRRPEPPAKPHRRRAWELAREVLARDQSLGWNLVRHPGRLRLRTFDSLCLALTRQMPLLSGFGTTPATVDDATPLYREAAREMIADLESGQAWSPSMARLLSHLDNNLGLVEELLVGMLARRDQWMRRLGSGPENLDIARRQLETGLAHVNLDALAAVAAVFPAAMAPELLPLARYAARQLRDAGTSSAIVALEDLTAMPPPTLEALPHWRALAELLLTDKGTWRKRLDKNIGFPPEKKGSDDSPMGSRRGPRARDGASADSPKQRMSDLIAGLSSVTGLQERLAALSALPPAAYDDRQWETLVALVQLLPITAAKLSLVFGRHAQADYTAVAHAAATALGTPDDPADLALALDYRIRHILVDEFQDTSYTQYELLERLTAGWSAGDGRTLFVVGDPMQSIYRFREAEIGLYLRARREGVGSVTLEPLTLTSNFRSEAGIVGWVNESFARIFPDMEDLASGAVTYSPSTAVHPAGDGAAVTVHPLFAAGPGAEAELAARLIDDARRADPDGSIAVLVRNRPHLTAIVAALRRRKIQYLAIDIEPLGHRPAVQDLLAITRALESHTDRVVWLAILRAPWSGLSLADLLVLAGDDAQQPLWQAMQDSAKLARLSEDGRIRLSALQPVLERALEERGRTTRRRAVESIWLALGGPAFVVDWIETRAAVQGSTGCGFVDWIETRAAVQGSTGCGFVDASDLDDAEVYLDLLESLERPGEILDIAYLEKRMTKLYALPDTAPANAVQLLTIHKAKGLEFDTVIIPGLGRPPRNDSPSLLLWAEVPRAHDRFDLLLAPLRPAGDERDAVYDYLNSLERERRRHEEKRLLYVAATRARRRLHLIGHTRLTMGEDVEVKPPAVNSLLATLWPAVAQRFQDAAEGAAIPVLETPAPASGEIVLAMRRPLAWQCPPPPAGVFVKGETPVTPPPVEYDWAGETARHVGSVVHRWLLRIAEEGLSRWDAGRVAGLRDAVIAMLRRHGVANAEITQAAEDVLTGLQQTLEDPRGRWLLGAQSEARSEYALTGSLDGEPVRVVLDRTFVDEDGRRWIVDYKTGIHTGADLDAFLDREHLRYAAQLERYARLLSALDPRPIRLGLYFPRLKGWREWGG